MRYTLIHKIKLFLLARRFILRTDHKPLIYLFASDEKVPNTALARIRRWAIALIRVDFKLNNTSGEQLPHADVLTKLNFHDNDDND